MDGYNQTPNEPTPEDANLPSASSSAVDSAMMPTKTTSSSEKKESWKVWKFDIQKLLASLSTETKATLDGYDNPKDQIKEMEAEIERLTSHVLYLEKKEGITKDIVKKTVLAENVTFYIHYKKKENDPDVVKSLTFNPVLNNSAKLKSEACRLFNFFDAKDQKNLHLFFKGVQLPSQGPAKLNGDSFAKVGIMLKDGDHLRLA